MSRFIRLSILLLAVLSVLNAGCTKVEEPIAVSSVTLSTSSISLKVGETYTLTATISPDNADNKKVIWSSDNASVASVDNSGVVTAVAPGETSVIAKSDDGGKQASCKITVTSRETKVTGVSLNQTSMEIAVGDECVLTATVTPEDATNRNVSWMSSDDAIASVANGKVKALTVGKAKITVETEDGGKTAECSVNVVEKTYAVESVSLNRDEISLVEGESETLTAKVLPENATNKNISWSVADDKIATVDDGKVTAVKAGETKVTVTTEDGGKTAECKVKVTAKTVSVQSVTLDKESLEMGVEDTYTLKASISPSNATDKSVSWESGNPLVATVSDGLVTAISPGEAIVKVITVDGGKTAECLVTVKSSNIVFEDATVKAICVNAWDTDGDHELSYAEANLVTDLGSRFKKKTFKSFRELKYFNAVSEIPDEAFYECEYLENIELPANLIKIGKEAFCGNVRLKSIIIPDSVESFGEGAFFSCESLADVNIPDGIKEIPDHCFCWNFAITKIVLPESVEYIGPDAFSYCDQLKDVNIPSKVRYIGKSAFEYAAMESVTIPDGVTCIDDNTFNGCEYLKAVKLPDSIKDINGEAFKGCKELVSINIPASLATIGNSAFSGCTSLEDIPINDNLMSIGSGAFANTAVIKVTIPSGIYGIPNSLFRNCSKLEEITMHDNIYSIGSYAFEYCTSLTSFDFPSKLSEIDNFAFHGCAIQKTVTLPSTLKSIGAHVFSDIENFVIYSTTPPTLAYYEFTTEGTLKNIFVLAASVATYKADKKWSYYAKYIVAIEE